jgi:DNA helicase-2/ATP-dependent DNA helicase PcrA
MTLHKSKGLEFAHVFLPAWETGMFPSQYGDIDEERRLADVALTRAMRRATISHAEFRRGFAGPSRFIADIPDAHQVVGWLRDQATPDRARRKTKTVAKADAILARIADPAPEAPAAESLRTTDG